LPAVLAETAPSAGAAANTDLRVVDAYAYIWSNVY